MRKSLQKSGILNMWKPVVSTRRILHHLFKPLSRWHLYSNYVNGKDTAGFLDYGKNVFNNWFTGIDHCLY